jgi:serine protease
VSAATSASKELDLVAPGGEGTDPILSTWPTYATIENLQRRVRTLNYALSSGTSMATPHVTAVAALLLAREPELSPTQVRARLIATAQDIGIEGFDSDSGYGRLDAYRALQAKGDGASF